ncbi:hypothetical protein [Chitinophaga qingshengii]|uniref:Uncharacterized protein n=1 Tax=Chitinophaga qingshengii TaxID=1569794 RepID=A0ABR7TKF8_9BACT|nr:hypothetical protein [Chitinophaga qingshengii]MBC9930145.1 hypothetical protein [Chitinophaga qingshengii]
MQLFNGRLYPGEMIPYLEQFNKEGYVTELKNVIDLGFQKISGYNTIELYTCCIATNIYELETSISFDDVENSDQYRKNLFATLEKRYRLKLEQGKLTKRDRVPDMDNIPRNYDEPDKYAFPRIASVKNTAIPKNFEFYTQRKCWYEIFPLQQEVLQYAVGQLGNLPKLHPSFEMFFIGMESKEGFIYKK